MAGLIGWSRQKTHSFEKAVVCYLSFSWFTCFLVSSSPFLYSTLQIKVPRNPLAKKDFSLFLFKGGLLKQKRNKELEAVCCSKVTV